MAANPGNKKIWLAALVVLALLIIFFVVKYNGFVTKEESVNKQWNNLQNEYQRRLDLIPNLVSVVKGSTDFEQQTLTQLAEARAKAAQTNVTMEVTAENYEAREAAQAAVVANANKLIAVVEKYPDLQSNKNFSRLQDQLEGTERRVKYARKDFNETIAAYNNSVRSFPGNLVAGIMGFKVKNGFKADAGASTAPQIDFNTKKTALSIFSIFKKKALLTADENRQIVEALRQAEKQTSGEVRVYIESHCSYVDPVDRAIEIFGTLKMANTKDRNAVLIYLALKDRQLAVFGDEGIHQRVGSEFWQNAVKKMIAELKTMEFPLGVCHVALMIGETLKKEFPYATDDKNELPDEIVFGR